MQKETEWAWEKEKMTKKISFLKQKQKYKPPQVDDYQGKMKSWQKYTKHHHGDIPLSDSEKEVLCLPPGIAVYDKISKVKIETITAMYPALDTDQVAADVAREFLDCELHSVIIGSAKLKKKHGFFFAL